MDVLSPLFSGLFQGHKMTADVIARIIPPPELNQGLCADKE